MPRLKPQALRPAARAFYRRVIAALLRADMPFLVGGGHALERYTGIKRHTKDLDLFVRRRDYEPVMQALGAAGFRTEHAFPHWLGKVYCGEEFVDVIYSSGNAMASVDDEWFTHAEPISLLGLESRACPAEEIIWSKAYVMERERFDGADVAHLVRARGSRLDWERLLRRFGLHWQVLLSHVVLFDFIYPGERAQIPAWLRGELGRRTQDADTSLACDAKECRGTLLSRTQYLVDIEQWGYADGRLRPNGPMSEEEVALWTAAIERER